MRKNSTLLILASVMLINALAYGIIIPLLYPYASRFGINPFGLSMLFASFSLAQLISTPILGRMSDRFGRKNLLLLCLLGTSLALGIFAAATNVAMLFLARFIDGITGGNISIAQAMIADSTKGTERVKAFGILGASFGFGFLFGPALGGILSSYGLTVPFWFASGLALLATIAGFLVLPETLPAEARKKKYKTEHLFRWSHYTHVLFTPGIGAIFLIVFLATCAQNAWIIGFQSVTVDVFQLSSRNIGLLFTLAGVITVIMQAGGLTFLLKFIPSKQNLLALSIGITTILLFLFASVTTLWPFVALLLGYMVVFAPITPMTTGILSERTKTEDQGGVLGMNQSLTSFGQIIGPLAAGLVTLRFSAQSVFFLAGCMLTLALASCWLLYRRTEVADL